MSDITLSAGVRSNLLSLQNTAKMMEQTQTRLATGKEVNSALDDPTNFFTSQSLNARSNDLSSLLDSMSNGIKTIEAADNGLTAMTKTLETMQATLRQARQDATFQVESFTIGENDGTVEFTGGQFGDDTVTIDTGHVLQSDDAFTALDGDDFDGTSGDMVLTLDGGGFDGEAINVSLADGDTLETIADEINSAIDGSANVTSDDISANVVDGQLEITTRSGVEFTATNDSGDDSIVEAIFNDGNEAESAAIQDADVNALVNAINSNSETMDKVRASNDNGELRIENLSTSTLSVDIGDGPSGEIGGNEVRAGLADEFNTLRDQLDKLSDDASFNGINLLRGDQLTLTFNETGTSEIDIQTQSGEAINSANLDLFNIDASQLDGNSSIDDLISDVSNAMSTVRSQSSNFGSNLSIVENRTEFTEKMMNTLQTGADSLVLADTNEEGANMLALQTRQQLSSVALSMASQSDQAVLRLF